MQECTDRQGRLVVYSRNATAERAGSNGGLEGTPDGPSLASPWAHAGNTEDDMSLRSEPVELNGVINNWLIQRWLDFIVER